MIIFDLDGTLADCEHRRHFVDPEYLDTAYWKLKRRVGGGYDAYSFKTGEEWKADWQAFYEACDQDKPIEPVIQLFKELYLSHAHTEIQIWSGRCESVRKKTLMWLDYHINPRFNFFDILQMRPIGDNTPDDQLKERWLDETLSKKETVEFVFDDRPKVIRMWRRRGIFVFNCLQNDKDF